MNKLYALIFSIVTLAVALIPTGAVLLFGHLIEPQDFWQKFAVYGLGILLVGSTQIAFLVFWIYGIILSWGLAIAEDIDKRSRKEWRKNIPTFSRNHYRTR